MRAEFLLAFSCKCRYSRPSCHARRLALWCDWLDSEFAPAGRTPSPTSPFCTSSRRSDERTLSLYNPRHQCSRGAGSMARAPTARPLSQPWVARIN